MFMIFHISPFTPTKNYNLYQTQRPFVTGTNKAHDVYAPSFCAQTSNTQFEDELKTLTASGVHAVTGTLFPKRNINSSLNRYHKSKMVMNLKNF